LFTFVGASRGHLCDSTAFLFTIALMSGVVVLNVLLRITVDISNNVILLK